MPDMKQRIADARRVNMIEYLRRMGHTPPNQSRPDHALFRSPLREDRNPSFSVSLVNGVWNWYDLGRGTHGDLIDIVMEHDKLSFTGALDKILGDPPAVAPVPVLGKPPMTNEDRTRWAKRVYFQAKAEMTPERESEIRDYFSINRLPYYPHIGAVWLSISDHEEPRQEYPYVAFPLPGANVHFMRGLMCRALYPTEVPESRRRLFRGNNTPWILRRRDAPVLITESITDCLAGDVLFGHCFTLLSANGLRKPEDILPYLERLKSRVVYLALDNEQEREQAHTARKERKGPTTQQEFVQCLVNRGIHTMEVRVHHNAQVKDLHRLLIAKPHAISPYELTRTGIHHQPQSVS